MPVQYGAGSNETGDRPAPIARFFPKSAQPTQNDDEWRYWLAQTTRAIQRISPDLTNAPVAESVSASRYSPSAS